MARKKRDSEPAADEGGGVATLEAPAVEAGAEAVQTSAQPLAAGRYEPALALELLTVSPSNPRKHFDAAAITALAKDLRDNGQIHPILVRPADVSTNGEVHQYEIVVGECRYRAAKEAGLPALMATVRELSDVDVLKIQLAENAKRQDITPLEEAAAYQDLMQKAGWDAKQLAADQKVSVRQVYARLALLKLPKDVAKALADESITAAHAETIASIPTAEGQKWALEHAQISSHEWDAVKQQNVEVRATVPVRDFNEMVRRQVYRELKAAPWNLKDAELVPDAGACVDCPKNSENDAGCLFAGGKACCGDGKCFAAKMQAHIAARQKELRAIEGDCVRVSETYGTGDKGVIPSYRWEESKAKNATVAIVADGPNQGKEIRVKIQKTEHSGSHDKRSKEEIEKEKAKLEREAERRKFEEALTARIYLALVANTKKYDRELLTRLVVQEAEYIDQDLEGDDARTLAGLLGCKKTHLSEKDVIAASNEHFARIIAAIAYAPRWDYGFKHLVAEAKKQDIDVKAIEEKLKADMAGVPAAKPDSEKIPATEIAKKVKAVKAKAVGKNVGKKKAKKK